MRNLLIAIEKSSLSSSSFLGGVLIVYSISKAFYSLISWDNSSDFNSGDLVLVSQLKSKSLNGSTDFSPDFDVEEEEVDRSLLITSCFSLSALDKEVLPLKLTTLRWLMTLIFLSHFFVNDNSLFIFNASTFLMSTLERPLFLVVIVLTSLTSSKTQPLQFWSSVWSQSGLSSAEYCSSFLEDFGFFLFFFFLPFCFFVLLLYLLKRKPFFFSCKIYTSFLLLEFMFSL